MKYQPLARVPTLLVRRLSAITPLYTRGYECTIGPVSAPSVSLTPESGSESKKIEKTLERCLIEQYAIEQ